LLRSAITRFAPTFSYGVVTVLRLAPFSNAALFAVPPILSAVVFLLIASYRFVVLHHLVLPHLVYAVDVAQAASVRASGEPSPWERFDRYWLSADGRWALRGPASKHEPDSLLFAQPTFEPYNHRNKSFFVHDVFVLALVAGTTIGAEYIGDPSISCSVQAAALCTVLGPYLLFMGWRNPLRTRAAMCAVAVATFLQLTAAALALVVGASETALSICAIVAFSQFLLCCYGGLHVQHLLTRLYSVRCGGNARPKLRARRQAEAARRVTERNERVLGVMTTGTVTLCANEPRLKGDAAEAISDARRH